MAFPAGAVATAATDPIAGAAVKNLRRGIADPPASGPHFSADCRGGGPVPAARPDRRPQAGL